MLGNEVLTYGNHERWSTSIASALGSHIAFAEDTLFLDFILHADKIF